MGNKIDTVIRYSLGVVIIIILTIIALRKPHESIVIQTGCKEDSLKAVISDLEGTLKRSEDGWDSKETRYENILFEYEYGLNRIKETHPDAYREFHRIISFKENYSHEDERDNKKRMNISKFN